MVFLLKIGSGSRFRDWRNLQRIPTTTFSAPRCMGKPRAESSIHRRQQADGVPGYKLKEKLGYQRRRPATRLTALDCADTLWVFRDLRVRPIG